MATRLYFSKIAPNVVLHDTSKGTWNTNGSNGGYLAQPHLGAHWTWRLTPTKSAAGAKVTPNGHTNQQGDFDAMYMEWMTYPLDAQTIAGTIDLCAFVYAQWNEDPFSGTDDSIVRFKLHVYIAVGQSRTVRHTLLDNYVDATDLPNPGTSLSPVWTSLTSPQALTSGDCQAGDVIVVEYGYRVVSSPTPTPTYPPSATTTIFNGIIGAVAAQADATPGSTNSSLTAWLEFSQNLTFQAAPSAPSNALCVNAIPVSTFPYQSPLIDTSQATGTQREAFWSFTVPAGRMVIHTLGSNYGTDIDLLGSCAGGSAGVTGLSATNELAAHRSQACFVFDIPTPKTFIVRIRNSVGTFNATNGGGALRLSAFFVQAPAVDDLYLPAGAVAVFREGQMVNIQPFLEDFVPTGIAIDYTQRPMDDLNGGTNTSIRVLVGLFQFRLIEILDATTLNVGESEIDFIGDPWPAGTYPGPGQLYCTAAGLIYSGWFGNGFLYVIGTGTQRPALMNAISDNPDFSALKIIDATHGDNQAGAPWPAATLQLPPVTATAAWAIQLDESSDILYYASGGVYVPMGVQTVQRWNVGTETALADFVTLPSGGGIDPDIRGMVLLEDRSILICNATRVVRVSAAGTILATYIPSVPLDSQTLIDVKITADERYFWVVDLNSTALFKFDLLSGLEVGYYPTYLRPGSLVQMALFNPAGQPPPPPPTPTTTVCPPVSWLLPAASGCVAIGELPDNSD